MVVHHHNQDRLHSHLPYYHQLKYDLDCFFQDYRADHFLTYACINQVLVGLLRSLEVMGKMDLSLKAVLDNLICTIIHVLIIFINILLLT